MSESSRTRWRARRRGVSVVAVVLGLLAGLLAVGTVAGAGTSVSPSGPGAVDADALVRDAVVDIEVDPGGLVYKKANAAGAYSYLNLGTASVLDLLGCAGDNSNVAQGAAGNRSPYTRVTVHGPNGFVHEWYSPSVNALALTPPFDPVAPQPEPDSTASYRGNTPPTQGGEPFTIPVELGDPGTYVVTTTTRNMVKTGSLGACSVGTPVQSGTGFTNGVHPAGTVLPDGGVVQPNGLVVEVDTFEYRPWQQVFRDLGGAGTVSFNLTPAESQVKVGAVTGEVVGGGITAFAAPGLGTFALPADPSACATDPASCLPSGAVVCDPGAGCEPRLVVINRKSDTEHLRGVFDLRSRAFIASAAVGGTQRILLSLGSDLDDVYRGLIGQLRSTLAARGLDLDELLGLGVSVVSGDRELTVTLLNGLQIDPATRPAGLHLLLNDVGVQAGLLLNVYSAITPIPSDAPDGYCAAAGSSADGVGYQRTAPVGYTVRESDLLPRIPTAAGLDALGVGGKVWNIEGEFRGVTPVVHLAGALAGAESSTSVPLLDADLLEVHRLLDAAAAIGDPRVPREMDFLGTAMWSASETAVPLVGCLTVDFMIGVGVNLLNNPLPVGLGDLPIWAENPSAAALMAAVDGALADAVAEVTANPIVADVLDRILALVPEVPLPV